ncbi:hypothetical protein [Phycicoccus sp.]|uniref:hypothetical protein n=1 Tax=Phycicoccus sp. TaxID=1902410 RepID=UPI002CF156DB|nr:hypothetical protein [Phycicoccus sp.]HMM95288.1 hypothetical protein [Phycicoccus sp.]
MKTARGREFVAHQVANDWISADWPDGSHGIITPLGVRCTEAEWRELLTYAAGTFEAEWRWEPLPGAAEALAAIDDDARRAALEDGLRDGIIMRAQRRHR